MCDAEQVDFMLLDLEPGRQPEGHQQHLDTGLDEHLLRLFAFAQGNVVDLLGHELILELLDEALQVGHFLDGESVQTGNNN